MANTKKKTDYHNSPAAWFCMLETARNNGNFEQAAKAVRELKRLGVTVKYRGNASKKLAVAEQALSKRKRTLLA